MQHEIWYPGKQNLTTICPQGLALLEPRNNQAVKKPQIKGHMERDPAIWAEPKKAAKPPGEYSHMTELRQNQQPQNQKK